MWKGIRELVDLPTILPPPNCCYDCPILGVWIAL